MEHLADGDRAAAGEVFRALWPLVHAFCRRAVGEVDDADDAAQAAMVKIFAEAPAYDRGRSVIPWARAIASWECRTLQRRHERRRQEGIEAAAQVADPGASPEETLALQQMQQAAWAVLSQLSGSDQETLLAAFSSEARDRFGVPDATFRKRRERALERLRQAWRRLHGG
jgi:RNA polymerase sigma-70 factor (ECF subfamily)